MWADVLNVRTPREDQVCGVCLNWNVWIVSLWSNVKRILTRVRDRRVIIVKDFKLLPTGGRKYWNATRKMFNQSKYNADETAPGSRWWWFYIFIFIWTSLHQHALHLFSRGHERCCRVIDALLVIREVPDWYFGLQSGHRDTLSLATIHIYSGIRRYVIYTMGIQAAARQVVLWSPRPHL